MESIFTSSDLYTFVMNKLSQPIPSSLKLSLLFKSIQKDFPVDKYMVVIFLNYTRCLINLQSDDISLIFKTSKLKYFKYWCFWREYMGFLINSNDKVDKIVDEGIKFLNVKEFPDKEVILRYLTSIKNDSCRDKYVYKWEEEWMTIEDIESGKIEDIKSGKIHSIQDNINYKVHDLINEQIDNSNYKVHSIDDVKSYKIHDVINDKIDNINYNKHDLGNDKIDNIKSDKKENNIKVQFTDISYSPALKRNPKSFPNTPITDEVNKYSYKDEVHKDNVIKCKIEDITLGEDTNILKMGLNNKEDNKENIKETSRDLFYLNNKKLQKINIIGKGGSSKVYKVFYENEFYALKIINIEMDSTLKDLLLEEIDLLKKLQNVEGIIKMIDYEVLTDNIYILLEYGESVLSSFIKSSNRLNSSTISHLHYNRVKYIWQEILLIVSNIHEKRIIHGDLKPANFVFVKNKLKIIDFGISKTLNSNTTRLDLDMVCGTLNYCAPELFFENKKRRSSDVWSLGIILHELYYGKTPLDSYKTYLEKKENIVNIRKNLKIISKVDIVISMCLNEDCRKKADSERTFT